jgi:hypothetical protein
MGAHVHHEENGQTNMDGRVQARVASCSPVISRHASTERNFYGKKKKKHIPSTTTHKK